MKWEILGGSAFPMISFTLEKGEKIRSESGSMVSMTGDLHLSGGMGGGVGKAIGRLFAGESFFMQEISAEEGPGTVCLATPMPGDIVDVKIQAGQDLRVQKNGFLAGTENIEVSTKMQSFGKGLFSGEGFFVITLSGTGTAFLSSYGAIYKMEVPEGEDVLVDNGHLVAWDAAMEYKITKGAKSWFSALVTSGEGFGCRFYGPGTVYVQTRNPYALGGWLFPFLPIPKNPR